jgi:cytochrome c oxidase cbb3-type subunit 3
MSEQNNKQDNTDKLLNSNYDGIQEYDNDLPRWWLNIFWITTIYALFYAGYVHLGYKTPEDQQLANEMKKIEELRLASAPPVNTDNSGADDAVVLAKLVSDSNAITTGKNTYVAKCAACHGQNGEGLIGPNLTDDNWIHGGDLVSIKKIIQEGVLDKGMLAWKAMLPDSEINSLVAYIRSIRGTNPANAKEPQGELYKP